MDISTVIGLVLGLGAMVGMVLLEGGSPGELIGIPAAVIVFGATFAASFVQFPLKVVLSLPKMIIQTFQTHETKAAETIDQLVALADRARRDGLLTLEETAGQLDQFLKKGIMLVVDGVDSKTVSEIMETEMALTTDRHEAGIGLLDAMGGYAPTMGILGTVMGLVNVLSKLSNPEELGHLIASAFLATLYGIASANLLWLPLAGKLRGKDDRETLARRMMMAGVLSIQAGESPRLVREKLESFLAPAEREKEED
ncbi:MAG: motility protein A [Anaerolineales bacterium]|nr:MAG: motility protein A [Anaerolineales bacterium]